MSGTDLTYVLENDDVAYSLRLSTFERDRLEQFLEVLDDAVGSTSEWRFRRAVELSVAEAYRMLAFEIVETS